MTRREFVTMMVLLMVVGVVATIVGVARASHSRAAEPAAADQLPRAAGTPRVEVPRLPRVQIDQDQILKDGRVVSLVRDNDTGRRWWLVIWPNGDAETSRCDEPER